MCTFARTGHAARAQPVRALWFRGQWESVHNHDALAFEYFAHGDGISTRTFGVRPSCVGLNERAFRCSDANGGVFQATARLLRKSETRRNSTNLVREHTNGARAGGLTRERPSEFAARAVN